MKLMTRWDVRSALLVVLTVVVGLPVFAAGRAQEVKLPVVATFSILGDVVQNVGGDRIVLTILVGPDGDAHSFEPAPGDGRALAGAAVVFENGLGFEGWLDRLHTGTGSRARRVTVNDGVQPLNVTVGGRTESDPHVWHDVTFVSTWVEVVRDALTAADPEGVDVYAANASAYRAGLRDLDDWVVAQVGTVPPERRKLVTSHDTFGYFARRYGFEVLGSVMASFSTEAQPSAAQIAALARDVRAAGVPAIFPENVLNPRLVARLATEARIGVAPALYTDALGARDSAGGTYVRMVQYNVGTIVSALRDWR